MKTHKIIVNASAGHRGKNLKNINKYYQQRKQKELKQMD